MAGRIMGYGHRAPRVTRRRLIIYAVLLAITIVLMAASSTTPVLNLQRGLAFALAPAQEAVNGIGNDVRAIVGSIGEIDRLRRDNATLTSDNTRLLEENRRLQALGTENEQLSALLQIRDSFQYKTVAARIIARDVADINRVVMIDKGSADGIPPGAVVVGSGGALAGRVTDLGLHSARVTLINDPASTVIGEVVSNRATGEVQGDLGGTLIMDKIDATQRVGIGDEVVTAGITLSGTIRSPYPKGLVVGRVVDATRDPNAVIQTAYLEPAIDLDRLEVVLVITNYTGGIPDVSPAPSASAQP